VLRLVSARPTDTVQIDRTKVGEHKGDYVATAQAGNKASASGTVTVSRL
jgi:hypothetical protein